MGDKMESMTPEQKAKELIEKFRDDPFTSQITTPGAKRCAVICVEEILSLLNQNFGANISIKQQYWEEVLTHLK